MAFSRRRLLGQAGLLMAGAGVAGRALAGEVPVTMAMALGPFYPIQKPADSDADMVQVAGRPGKATGKIIEVSGRILNRHGAPVPGAKIEIWQANKVGRYAHKSDVSAPLIDPNFDGFASLVADSEGGYRFLSIEPGIYKAGPTWRAKHIHYQVDGRLNRIVTQMYFAGDPSLGQDETLAQDLNQKPGGPFPPVIFGQMLGKRADGVERLGFDVVLIDG
jgi:protocatechuate 3,4-dioxygenase beta subunit